MRQYRMAGVVFVEAIGDENSLIGFSDGTSMLLSNLFIEEVLINAPFVTNPTSVPTGIVPVRQYLPV